MGRALTERYQQQPGRKALLTAATRSGRHADAMRILRPVSAASGESPETINLAETDDMHDSFESQPRGPLFRSVEFRELRPPAIEPPRRNYEPREGFVTMFAENPGAAAQGLTGGPKIVDLAPAELARGRANALAKRAGKAPAPRPPNERQRILELLRTRAPQALSSRQIADALGIDALQVSSRLGSDRAAGTVEAIAQPKTVQRLYRWIGATGGSGDVVA
jgi:hypothetical protein